VASGGNDTARLADPCDRTFPQSRLAHAPPLAVGDWNPSVLDLYGCDSRPRRTPRRADECHSSRLRPVLVQYRAQRRARQVMDLLGGAVRGGDRTGRAPARLLKHAPVYVYAVLDS